MRIHILLIALLSVFLCSCEDDENKDAPMNNLAHYKDVLFEDYLKLPANSLPALNGYFTPKDDAPPYLEAWLNSAYFSVDVGSTIDVTYDFMDYERADKLDLLTRSITMIGSQDYRFVWGTPFVEAFTPNKSADQYLPEILKNSVTNPTDGDYRILQYNYSVNEPTFDPSKEVVYYLENFETVGGGDWDELKVPNSYNLELTSSGRKWRVYNRGGAKAMFAYHNGVKKGDAWFITEQIDLASAVDPTFTVDIGIGYYLDDFLRVYVGDGTFDGENPLASGGWIDVTDALGVNSLPKVSGYPNLTTVSIKIPKSLIGGKINIAFRDQIPEATETYAAPTYYVVDNIKVFETRPYASVPSMELAWRTYIYKNPTWKQETEVLTLQEPDYDAIGTNTLTLEQAHELIPNLLQNKFPIAEAGDKVTIVYKQTEVMMYAASYEYVGDKWIYEQLPPVQKKTASFMYLNIDDKWKFVE